MPNAGLGSKAAVQADASNMRLAPQKLTLLSVSTLLKSGLIYGLTTAALRRRVRAISGIEVHQMAGVKRYMTLMSSRLIWSHNMSDLERTPAGLQMVIPRCERRTMPRSITRVDDIGRGLLGFYKTPTLREQLANRAHAPLRPSKGQKALPKSGLFGR
jgi:hypothetical protein